MQIDWAMPCTVVKEGIFVIGLSCFTSDYVYHNRIRRKGRGGMTNQTNHRELR